MNILTFKTTCSIKGTDAYVIEQITLCKQKKKKGNEKEQIKRHLQDTLNYFAGSNL